MTRIPIETSRWMLLLIILFAPWLYGSTPAWAIEFDRRWLLGMGAIFVLGLVVQRRLPRGSLSLSVGGACFLLYGWALALFPTRWYDLAEFRFNWLEGREGASFGSYDGATSIEEMALISGLYGAAMVAADLMANRVWLRRLWVTLAGVGVSIAFLALFQRVTGAEAIFWEPGVVSKQKFFFGPYLYHANAGAYLNLILPLVFGLIAVELYNHRRPTPLFTLWFSGAMVVITAIFINTSRASLIIGICLLLSLLGAGLWWLSHRLRLIRIGRKQIAAGGTLLAAIVALPWLFGWDIVWTRWKDGMDDLMDNGRFSLYELIWNKIVPEAGPWGFGPGTFEIVFPFFSHDLERSFVGILRHAHHDYLQLLVEFGWIGALLLVGAGAGTFSRALHNLYSTRVSRWNEASVFSASGAFALVGILIHAAFDFPLQIASLQLYAVVLLGVLSGYGALKN